MKFKYLLILFVPFILSSCKKSDSIDETPTEPVVELKPYTITEDFENGTKISYDVADATTTTGSWKYDGALIGTDKSDMKNGKKSVRIQGTQSNDKRNGILSMNFDVRHLKSVSIKSSFTNFSDKQRVSATVTVPLKATWELQFSKDGGKTFTKTGQTITETDSILVNHSFEITDTAAQRFRIVNTSEYNGASRVRLSIDDVTFAGLGESGVVIGGSDTDPDDGGGSTGGGSASTPRGVTIGSDAPPAEGDNSNLLFGNPSNATAVSTENFFINTGYYVESYSKNRGTPNWVSWHLDGTNTTNATARLDNFAGYSGLPADFYQVQNTSYTGSGFDRGHNCPSADRTSSANANSATFLMTNMIPQAPQNNQQTWEKLESELRAQVVAGNEVYIIMGSYGTGGIGKNSTAVINTLDNGRITVPSNVWKVAIIIPAGDGDLIRAANTGTVKVIAINTPNRNDVSSAWRTYSTTVRAIETAVTTATGSQFNLFSQLPQSVQDVLETRSTAGI